MNISHLKQILQKRTRQGGQAIAELAVCLMGLLVILLGFFLLSTLSQEGVTNVIAARQDADKNAQNGQSSLGGGNTMANISHWDYGSRGIPFNRDDSPVKSTSTGGAVFFSQLTDHSGKFDFRTAGNGYWLPEYYNPLKSLQQDDILLDAANLTAGVSSEKDPLGKRGLESLKKSARNILGVRADFEVFDIVFMPEKVEVPLPEEATGH